MGSWILVVDANPQIASATAQVLAEAGHQATSVTTFEDAVEEVVRDCPDLMITSVRLGRFNGLHLAARCHQEHPELPILVMGVGGDAKLAAEASEYDVRFVMKPATYEEVLVLVREMLAAAVPSAATEVQPPAPSDVKPTRPKPPS